MKKKSIVVFTRSDLGGVLLGVLMGAGIGLVLYVIFLAIFVEEAEGADRPNFVVILTDDQRFDTLWAMPTVQDRLVNTGVRFTNAFVTTPLCTPSRASLLSGGFYAHNTRVLTNTHTPAFDDTSTLATALQSQGYATALIGKYLNQYHNLWTDPDSPYIPPGWTRFVSTENPRQEWTWTRFPAVTGSSDETPGVGKEQLVEQYLTSYHRDQALAFLEEHGNTPFFLFLSTNAPHSPATPDEQDAPLFTDLFYRERAYGERDINDKPLWVSSEAWRVPEDAKAGRRKARFDELNRNMLRSLQSVDRTLAAIMDKIGSLNQHENTYYFFTSDNGYLLGEHRVFKKGNPYDESLRVPLVIAGPGVPMRTEDALVAMNLDIGTTICDLAGIPAATDGESLLPLLADPEAPWRNKIFLESYGRTEAEAERAWTGVRNAEWKYIEYATGERELYRLATDPFEKRNKYGKPEHAERVARMADRLAKWRGEQ